MTKLKIKNRKDQNIAVIVDQVLNQKGLAFVMHGLSGTKDQPVTQTIAAAFTESGYTAVRFDTTNTFGESDGRYEDATTTNYYEDLEDVIKWASSEEWYEEPFVLVGFSLGGLCVGLFAEEYPEKVRGLAPISAVVSGKMMVGRENHKFVYKEWERTGWNVTESESRPGLIRRLPWSFVIDGLKYDLLPNANKLAMPVLMVVGEKDVSVDFESQKALFDKLPGQKESHIIAGGPHTFRDEKHLSELRQLLRSWIGKL